MKQIIIETNKNIKEITGSKIEFFPDIADKADLILSGGKVTSVRIPFKVKVLSGGTLDLDFKISQVLAENGVSLIGAFWNGEEVRAYFMQVEGTETAISYDTPILVGTLVQVVSFRQVDGNIVGGVMRPSSGNVMNLDLTTEEKPKNKKGKKKDV